MNSLRIVALSAFCVSLGLAQSPLETAQKALEAKDFQTAIDTIDGAGKDVANSADGLDILAQAFLGLGNLGAALDVAFDQMRVAPEDARGFRHGAIAFYFRGENARKTGGDPSSDYEEAARIAKLASSKAEGGDEEMLFYAGFAHYYLGQQKESAAVLKEAHELNPKNPEYLSALLRAYSLLQRWDAVRDYGEKAAKLLPARAEFHRYHAQGLAKTQQTDAAIEAYTRGLQTKRLSKQEAATMAGGLWALVKEASDKTPALKALEKWTDAHPHDPISHLWKGWAYLQAKEPKKAFSASKKAWEVSRRRHAGAALQAGDALVTMAKDKVGGSFRDADIKRLEEATEWYLKGATVKGWNWGNSKPSDKCLMLFGDLMRAGRLADGARLLEEVALKADPTNWRINNNLALYYRDSGERAGKTSESKRRCELSRKYYRAAAKSVKADPKATAADKAGVLNDLGVLYAFPRYHAGDLDKGMGYFREALEYDAYWVDANENMGLFLNQLGRHADAISHLEKAVEKEPRRMVARRELRRAKAAVEGGG